MSYELYDLGVRRIAAHEGRRLPQDYLGHLFEQYIGLELIHQLRLISLRTTLKYWRDPSGPEVDWVIETPDTYIPIEVKWTDTPTIHDAKYLQIFLNEYPQATTGFIICRTPHAMKIADNIHAISWEKLGEILELLESSQ